MSRQPGSGNGLVYDEKLLDQAPQVTKVQRQEGYDADILNPTPPPASRSPPAAYNEHNADIEIGGSSREKHVAAGGYDPVEYPSKKPFWKTTKGLIIIAVIALVVIAAAVGGGVGGSVGKSKNNNNAVENQNTSNSTATPSMSSPSASQPTSPGGDSPSTQCVKGSQCFTTRVTATIPAATTGTAVESITGSSPSQPTEVPGGPADSNIVSATFVSAGP